MFSITFSKGKCSASHFVTQNVTNAFLQRIKCIFATQRVHFPKENVQHHILLHKMLQMYFGVHFPKENVQLCKNAFDAKMHLMRCQNAFWHQMHFGNAYILRSKMFSITFYFVKCSASHFPLENVRKNTFCKAKCSAQPPWLPKSNCRRHCI